MGVTDIDRSLARGMRRRFANEELSPDELRVEIERWEQHRALLVGDLEARDFSQHDEATISNGIAYADVRLQELERQGHRFLRSQLPKQQAINADFERIKYVDLIGLAQTLLSQPGSKRGDTYVFRCFMHDERTPSLTVYPPGRGWHCFGCDKGGRDAASFCAEFFHCSQIEGLRWVIELCDVPGAE